MSWLGGSLNSLTGHISSFTKEVLIEGREEISDHTTELRLAQQKIQELEQQCTLQRQEVERLKNANTELENRCHASELQMSAVSSECRALVQQKNEEIRTLKQNQQEELESCASWSPGVETCSSPDRGYSFLGDDADFGDLISSQHEINRLAAEVRKLRAERDKWRERARRHQADDDDDVEDIGPNRQLADNLANDYEQLKAKEQELQSKLQEIVDQHQQQLAVLQNHYSQKISELQKAHQSEVKQLREKLLVLEDGIHEGNGDENGSNIRFLQSQIADAHNKETELNKQVAELQGQLREKDRTVQLLSRQMEKLQTDKTKFEKKFEETTKQQLSVRENLKKLQEELEDRTNELTLAQEKLKEQESIVQAKISEPQDNDINALRKKLEESEKLVEELRNKREQVCNDSYATKLKLLAHLEAHHNNTAEVLEDIQVARKRVSFAADERHAFHLHEKQEIINKMIEASEQKSKLKKLIASLDEESFSVSSEILKLIQALGNSEHQEMVAGFINTIQLENKVLKTRNDELESMMTAVHEKFGIPELQSPRNVSESPDNVFTQESTSSDHQSWFSITASTPRDAKSLKCSFTSSAVQGLSFNDQEDLESLASSAVSELSVRNRELDEQVQVLQQQIETYERDIEHFELVRADWQAERSAMEEVLLKLRAQLRQKEESLSVVTARRGLMEVKKKGPLTEVPEEVILPEDYSGGGSTEGDFDLERLQEQIEEMTQGNAQLENERDVLRAEKQGLLKEIINLRQMTQQLQEKIEKLERLNSAETSSVGGTTSINVSELEEMMEEKNLLEQNLIELDQQHQEAMEKVLEIKKQLCDENKNLQERLRQTEEKFSVSEHENLLLKVEVETLREQMDQLIPAIREGRNAKSDAGGASNLVTELSDEDSGDNADVQQEALKSMLQAVHTLNTDNLSLEEDISALQEERKQLELRVSQLEKEREELALQNEELQKEVTTLQECSLLMEELHEENKKLDEILRKKTQKLEEEELKIAELLRKVEALELMQKDLTEEKDAAWRKVEDCLIENDNLKSEFVELNSRLSLQEREIDALKKELDKSKQDNKALQKLLKTSEEKLERVQSKYKNKIEELQQTVSNVSSDAEEKQMLKQKVEELEIKMQKADEEKALLKTQCSDKTGELNSLKVRIKEMENERENLNSFISKYEEDISALKSQMKMQERICSSTVDASLQTTYANYDVSCQTDREEKSAKCDIGCQIDVRYASADAQSQTSESSEIQVSPKNKETEEVNRQNISDARNQAEQLGLKVGELSKKLEEKEKLLTMKEEEVRKCNEIIKELEASASHEIAKEMALGQKIFVSTAIQHPGNDNQVFSDKDVDESNVNISRKNSNTLSGSSDDNKIQNLLEKVQQLEVEKEKMMLVLNDKTQECTTLKTEVLRLVNIVSAEKQALAKLQQDNQELMQRCEVPDQTMTKEAVQNLSCIIRDKDLELEALKQKVNTLLAVLQQSSSEGSKIEELLAERENLMRELGAYKADREKIIIALNHKYHESLRYHAEMQRLQGILASESLKYDALNQEHRTVSQQFEEKQKSLMNTQNELISLKQRVSELERQHSDLCQKYDQVLNNKNSNNVITVDSQEWSSKLQQIEQLKETVVDKEKWLFEKDQMVHQLSQEVQKQKEEVNQRDATLKGLQRQIENLNSKLNMTSGETMTAQKDVAELQKHLNNAKSEVLVLNESNKRLSMVIQEREFEVQALQDKVATLTSLLQEKSSSNSSANTDVDRLIAESEAMQLKAQQFQHERDEMMLALSQRQQEYQDIQSQVNQAREKEERLIKEVERLRAHLLQVEDTYTREVLAAEEREKELRNRLAQTEEKIQMSSSAFQNANQQSIVQVESLQEQLRLVIRQRDEAQSQVSHLEDRVHQHAASIYNLQLVIEQYQKERERELQEVKKRHQTELKIEQNKVQNLVMQLQQQEEQMAQTSEALDAASRLSEQLDRKEEMIAALREEVSSKEALLQKLEQEINNVKSSTEGKVDKQVMKNLVLGYFSTPTGQRPEVMRLLAKVLDFSQDEMSKAGIKIGKETKENAQLSPNRGNTGGWITSFLGRTTPANSRPSSPSSAVRPSSTESTSSDNTKQSFSSLFVQFLQKESQPPPQFRLPAEEMAQELTRKHSLPSKPNKPARTNPFLTENGESEQSSLTQIPSLLPSDHLLMRPISDALPTFAPVPVKQTSNAASSASFLQEVLK